MLANVQQVTIKPFIQATIAPGTCIYTDEYDIYSRLEQWGYAHESVCHSEGNTLAMMTVTAFTKCTLIPWKAFGRC